MNVPAVSSPPGDLTVEGPSGDKAIDGLARSYHLIPLRLPYRLDLTINVLRRLPTNPVDTITADGAYVRLLGDLAEAVIVRVRQPHHGTLAIELQGNRHLHARMTALISRMLGVDVDLSRFYERAAFIPWLQPLVSRMRGVKPPTYPTLWEACVNAIVFQQLSLVAASEIMRRLIVQLGEPVLCDQTSLYRFPDVGDFLAASDARLRAAGLSKGKLGTLRRVGAALGGGLNEALLLERQSSEAAALLRRIKGIGPWTAAVILLRGLEIERLPFGLQRDRGTNGPEAIATV